MLFPHGAEEGEIDKLINYIETHRADDLKEALRLYDIEIERKQIKEQLVLQTLYASMTATSAQAAARAAQVAAENTSSIAAAANETATYTRLNLNK